MNEALAGPSYAIAIVVYLLIMVAVGCYFGKKARDEGGAT